MRTINPSTEMLACMKQCGECAQLCSQCAHHCLHLGDEHASPEHQCMLHDCAGICSLAACFIARSSPHSGHLCNECAEICTLCADQCEGMAKGDTMMTRCVAACRSCAAACQKMSTAAV
jgi:hypothetical protein